MTGSAQYRRILVKLSGESFSAASGLGFDPAAASKVIEELRPLLADDVQIALVVGAGNFIRGRHLADAPEIRKTTADYMGMLATVINGLALRDALESAGIPARVLSAFDLPPMAEPFNPGVAAEYLDAGCVVIFVGGTGCPFFTTDTCAALRANEIGAEALVKATKVDGVFDSDPQVNASAKKYDRLTYRQVVADRLGVMDLVAVELCQEHHLPIIVLELLKPGNLAAAVRGEPVGTLVAD
jgi:uridylate kinase